MILLATLATALALLVAAPALATEAGNGAAADEGGKITFPSNPHDQFGLVLIGLTGLAALGAGANAFFQLKGRRPQASGKIRWR